MGLEMIKVRIYKRKRGEGGVFGATLLGELLKIYLDRCGLPSIYTLMYCNKHIDQALEQW